MDFDAYMTWENAQPTRNELYQGRLRPVADVGRVHGTVLGSILGLLHTQLKSTDSQLFAQSAKLQIGFATVLYPDIFVTRDKADLQTDMIFTAPTVIVEVLSEATHAYDRSLKFAAYRQIASLQEYLLIDPDTRVMELYRRNAQGLFTLHDFTGQVQLSLTSIACELIADDIFDGLATTQA